MGIVRKALGEAIPGWYLKMNSPGKEMEKGIWVKDSQSKYNKYSKSLCSGNTAGSWLVGSEGMGVGEADEI